MASGGSGVGGSSSGNGGGGARRRLLEVCVDSLAGALAAEAGGADRLELCSALGQGGLTPGPGLLGLVRERVSLPVVVLVRPRPGGFCYTPDEVTTLLAEVAAARAAGAAGVAVGALDASGAVDRPVLQRLLEAADGLPLTFHRAFDLLAAPEAGLELLAEAGVACVLTSGGRPSVPEALDPLARLVRLAGERLVVMPGGGVRSTDVARIVATTGARALHASARRPRPGGSGDGPHGSAALAVSIGGLTETDERVTDVREVAALAAALAAAP